MNSSVDSSMTMSDRLLMEPTFDLEEDEEVESGETVGEKSGGSVNNVPEANNLDDVQVNTCDQGQGYLFVLFLSFSGQLKIRS